MRGTNAFVLPTLNNNVELNGVGELVRIANCGLSSQTGTSALVTPYGREESSGASMVQNEGVEIKDNGGQLQQVRLSTLDKIVEHYGLEQLGLVKIDTEGMETQVIYGGRESLRRFKPVLIVEILSLEALLQVEKYLMDIGYGAGHPLDGTRHSGGENVTDDQVDVPTGQNARNYRFQRA